MRDALLKLQDMAKKFVAADTDGHAAVDQQFNYRHLKIVAAETPTSGRFTRHVELELPEGMKYIPGNRVNRQPVSH